MRRMILSPMIVVLCVSLTGCGAVVAGEGMRGIIEAGREKDPCWLYEPNLYEPAGQRPDATAVVIKFADGRKDGYVDHSLRCISPFLIYCTNEYEPPERCQNNNFLMHVQGSGSRSTTRIDFDPMSDFGQALAAELQAGSVFREVDFGDNTVNRDYVISGRVLDTTLKDTLYTYGFLGFGMFFWGFGLPAGSFTNDLSVEITCANVKTGQTVLSKAYTAPQYHQVFWLYAQRNSCRYGEMMQPIYKQFVEDLRAKLAERKLQ